MKVYLLYSTFGHERFISHISNSNVY